MIRLTTGRAALFGAMLLVALLAFLPLRLVLGIAGDRNCAGHAVIAQRACAADPVAALDRLVEGRP